MSAEQKLHEELKSLGIAFEQVDHPAVFTTLDSSQIEKNIAGAATKNLFLKDADGHFALVTVPAEKRVDLGQLRRMTGAKRYSFGSADEMEQILGVTPGSVTPLAAMNVSAGKVQIVIDEILTAQPRVNVHPLRNTATISLSGLALVQLLVRWRHAPLIIPVPSKAAGPEPA
ncbi:prolyl-tRNA synthetase associated domain-containing protein [Alterisphingorhabdus coralli]|uniref:Prolyl-tRNA synthetase associated domain-containing protein n=1 Tax=Alterisphingorhabdus coralli TaxID=3071408 RepID=A0AA97F7X0_9SPHN|nr:prolyl-tRNA synthetase associated domain-containing protein [Parasphingorhabdus sp. SCSIO 66989]WOE74917.1 prolyl-tRNA synthetase associated domain-containing protein [Parasphingorhabdus sp. SCSIO 66989]